jgi:hypothetical protein
MKNFILILTGLSIAFFLPGCSKTKKGDTNLYEHRPVTAAKKEVYDFFVECEKAISGKNLDKYLACYNDGAKVKISKGDGDDPMVTKAGYRNHLKGGAFSEMQSRQLRDPQIFVYGNKASVRCSKIIDEETIQRLDYRLVKDRGQWRIIRLDYKMMK